MICVLVSAVTFAYGQARGIPASATSAYPGNDRFTPGLPASVASPGPSGFFDAARNQEFFVVPRRDRLRRVVYSDPIPLFYPAPFFYVQAGPEVDDRATESQKFAALLPPPPQKIIVEIREMRPEVKPVTAQLTPREEQVTAPPFELRTPTVFIFRDGSRKELRDFAIMEGQLIDLADGRTRRFQLKDLDHMATLKFNAENGIEVHLPAPASD